jgi:hypothetical protein
VPALTLNLNFEMIRCSHRKTFAKTDLAVRQTGPNMSAVHHINTVQTTVASAMKTLGLAKKGSSWYLHREETILVVELQKSNYGATYFVNVAVWLCALGDSRFPKEWACHIRSRLDELVGNPDRLAELLNLEHLMGEREREAELSHELTTTLSWIVRATSSVDALRSGDGARLQSRSLVTGPAQELLTGSQ